MDWLFGTSQWRPMPLFALRQNNKDRLIADGRCGGHNGYTFEQESLLLPNVDFVAFAVRAVIPAIREEKGHFGVATHDNSLSVPGWFEARLGTDDVLDAFPQLTVFLEHRPLNTGMWFDTRANAYRFATVNGMVFWSNVGCQCFLQVLHFCGGTGTTHGCRPGHGIC